MLKYQLTVKTHRVFVSLTKLKEGATADPADNNSGALSDFVPVIVSVPARCTTVESVAIKNN